MADSYFDKLDEAHAAYLRRHKHDERLVDDVDPGSREPMAALSGDQGRGA